jgi:hypothetical protein
MSTANARVGLLLGLIGLGAVAACERTTGPNTERRLGFLDYPVEVSVPDTVAVGTPATVSIKTFGNSCASKGETETTVTGMSALVLPYDYHRGTNCLAIQISFWHRANIVFERSGTATVTFVGVGRPDANTAHRILTVERTITVK